MPRIRTIKPEFSKHEGLYDLEQETGLPIRLSWACLWMCCDREGRFKWRPRQLKADCLPYDDLDFADVLDALLTHGFIVRYACLTRGSRVDDACLTRGSRVVYGAILSWPRHQFVNNKEPKSEIPPPSEEDCKLFENQQFDACLTRGSRVDDACLTRGVKEGKGREGNVKEGKEQNPSARQKTPTGLRPDPSQVSKALCEVKHTRIRGMIEAAYQEANDGAPCPWDGSEAGQLANLLKATPKWDDALYAQCLDHMYRSEGFAAGTRPREFLGSLPRYAHGTLDRFKSENGSNGHGETKAERRTRTINESTRRVYAQCVADLERAGNIIPAADGRNGEAGMDFEPVLVLSGGNSGSPAELCVPPSEVHVAKRGNGVVPRYAKTS